MSTLANPTISIACVNGVALHAPNEIPSFEALRQRACTELLRQAAQHAGLLDASDTPGLDGSISEAAAAAIDAHIDGAVRVPPPTDETCRRYFAANTRSYASGERLRLRHILFAVTPGVDVNALRKRAETTLLDVRTSDAFAEAARTLSNCPTGTADGDLGWLAASDCAFEFAKDVFSHVGVGVLPRLVHSRFGFHVVEVLEREGGVAPAYEAVRGAVAKTLERQAFVTALRQYLQVLTGNADIEGVDLESADTPLVQ